MKDMATVACRGGGVPCEVSETQPQFHRFDLPTKPTWDLIVRESENGNNTMVHDLKVDPFRGSLFGSHGVAVNHMRFSSS